MNSRFSRSGAALRDEKTPRHRFAVRGFPVS
jgi:hypothetical protein